MLSFAGPYGDWEVALIDEQDHFHHYRVFANSESKALQAATQEALDAGHRTANDWGIGWAWRIELKPAVGA